MMKECLLIVSLLLTAISLNAQEFAQKVILVKLNAESNIANQQRFDISQEASILDLVSNETLKVLRDNEARYMERLVSKTSRTGSDFKWYRIEYNSDLPADQLCQLLQASEDIAYAEPDFTFKAQIEIDDTYASDQYYLEPLQANIAWDRATGEGQVIAILDTGVDPTHEDLSNKLLPGYNFVDGNNNARDDNMHGTHVAGIAAAEFNNAKGIAGIAPDAMILPVKVLDKVGIGTSSQVVQGLAFAVDNGADVINMSFGASLESLAVKEALAEAYNSCFLVAAAGNSSAAIIQEGKPHEAKFPACYPFVMGVQALQQDLVLYADFSNYDPSGPVLYANQFGYNYEIKAPGVSILSCVPNNEKYRVLSGTSMAAPMVAGAAALLKSYDITLSNDEIFAMLIQSSNGGLIQLNEMLGYDLVPNVLLSKAEYRDDIDPDNSDLDGTVDAGESIGVVLEFRNAGGRVDNAVLQLALGELEDPNIATITKSEVNLGNVGVYSSFNNEEEPLIIDIPADALHDSKIVLEYIVSSDNNEIAKGQIVLQVKNSEELLGILNEELVLSPNKLWEVNGSFKIEENGVLILEPGTYLKINRGIINNGKVIANGVSDNRVEIEGPEGILGNGELSFYYTDMSNFVIGSDPNNFYNASFSGEQIEFDHVNVENVRATLFSDANTFIDPKSVAFENGRKLSIKNSDFKYFSSLKRLSVAVNGTDELSVENCNFSYFNNTEIFNAYQFQSSSFESFIFRNNNLSMWEGNYVINAHLFHIERMYEGDQNKAIIENNNFVARSLNSDDKLISCNATQAYSAANNYWGQKYQSEIEDLVFDFFDDPALQIIEVDPVLTEASATAPAMAATATINGVDIFSEQLEPVALEEVDIAIHFNRPMDKDITPFVTFGSREPRTQNLVSDGSWNGDGTIWTGSYEVDGRTADGINYLRVSNAYGIDGREIPTEDNLRWQFKIQTNGALSSNLNGEADFGFNKISWSGHTDTDVLGYNVYRFEKIIEQDTTYFTDTLEINNDLVLGTEYIDIDIEAEKEYYYMINSVNANFDKGQLTSPVRVVSLESGTFASSGDILFQDTQIGQTASLIYTLYNLSGVEMEVLPFEWPDGYSSQWQGGVMQPGEIRNIEVTFAPTETKVYSGFVNIKNNLDDTEMEIIVRGEGVILSNVVEVADGRLRIHPNPASDIIHVELDEKSISSNCIVEIYNLQGQLERRSEKSIRDSYLALNIADLPESAYILRIVCEDIEYESLIIKK